MAAPLLRWASAQPASYSQGHCEGPQEIWQTGVPKVCYEGTLTNVLRAPGACLEDVLKACLLSCTHSLLYIYTKSPLCNVLHTRVSREIMVEGALSLLESKSTTSSVV